MHTHTHMLSMNHYHFDCRYGKEFIPKINMFEKMEL